MPARVRWVRGWDDVVPLAFLATPMLLWAISAGPGGASLLIAAVASLASALVLKHLTPPSLRDLSLAPPAIGLLLELAFLPLTVYALLGAAAAGVGLLLWAGAEPVSRLRLRTWLEPAVVPALATGLAVGVTLFLPRGTGGQVGIAALILVAVLGLTPWIYLRTASEAEAEVPTS